MSTHRAIVKWSKKENDWVCHYPDRNGRIFGNNIFSMIKDWEKFMREDFREHLRKGGYDPDSFRVSVKKLNE